MPTVIVESLLHAWATWLRVEVDVGPEVDRAAGCAEGMWCSRQPWDDDSRRRPRIIVIDDELAMCVERCVIATGPVLAACLRSVYVRQIPPRRRAEVALLQEAVRRVSVLLGAPERAADAPERPQRRAPDAGAMSTSPESV